MTTYNFINSNKNLTSEHRHDGQLTPQTLGTTIHSVSLNHSVDFMNTVADLVIDGKVVKSFKWRISAKTGRPVLTVKTY
jgi:hypothetical protein